MEDSILQFAELLGFKPKENASSRPTPKRYTTVPNDKSHPFESFFQRYLLQDQLTRSQSSEVLRYKLISKATLSIVNLEGFERVLTDLKGATTFRDTISEVLCASDLTEKGKTIRFPQTKSVEMIKTPDIEVVENGNVVPIECKRVSTINSSKESFDKQWPTFANRILKVLYSKDQLHNVYIKFKVIPNDVILENILSGIKSNAVPEMWEIVLSNSDYEIWHKKTHQDISQSIDASIPASANFLNSVSHHFLTKNLLGLQDGVTLAYEIDLPRHDLKGLMSLFKDASKKIPENGPGVIAVEIPSLEPKDLEQYIKCIADAMNEKSYTRVSQVYLFWIGEKPIRIKRSGRIFQKIQVYTAGCIITNSFAKSPIKVFGAAIV